MKLTISRESLITPLQSIAGVVEKKQTMPVLSNVLLEAEDNTLTLTGTNMEVELVARVAPVHVDQPGRITVPARKLADICRALGDEAPIDLALEGDRLHLRSGNSHFTLSTLPAEHFPNVEDEPESFRLALPQKELGRMLDATAFAMAQQDVRYYLNGMLFELKPGRLRAVATDGHRLALCDAELDSPVEEASVILPRKGVMELSRILGDSGEAARLTIGRNHVRIVVGAITFTSKLVDGKFPEYDRVIPKEGSRKVVADRETLRQALARVAILSNEKYRGVRVQLSEGSLRIVANNPEQEEAEEEVSVDFNGSPLEIGFNVSYLLDVLNTMNGTQAELEMGDSNSSALVFDPESKAALYVVMPMRL